MTETPPVASTPGEFTAGAITTIGTLLSGLDRLDPILHLPEHPAPDAAGVPFGGFLLRARLGEGSYGIVVLADDPRLGRRVVVKVPQPVVLTDAEARERFVREARAAGVLDHPNVVPVYEAGEVGGLPYLAAGFVDGPTLAARLAQQPGPLPSAEAASLVRDLARGVHHAHERGVLHCDLKPSNVLLQARTAGPPEPMVTDFGMARILTDDPSLTRTRQQAGTPLYMSPEQARGDRRALTARSDVYALGAILFELLTGRPPHTGTDGHEITTRIANDPVPCPRTLNPAVQRDLRAVCLKCLAKEPGDRYASAASLADDLDRFLAGRPVEARPISLAVRACRWVRRRPREAAALLLTLAVTGTAVGVAVDRWVKHVEGQAKHEADKAQRDATEDRLKSDANSAQVELALEHMRQRRVDRVPGWSDSNLADIRRLFRSNPSTAPIDRLRSEAALALGGIDLGEPRVIAKGFRAYAPAFMPHGAHRIALGSKSRIGGQCEVRIFDPTTGEEVQRLKYQHDFGWELRHDKIGYDGCRSISYSFDGNWLVVGTRSGWLVRWDLREKDPKPVRWLHDPESVNSRKGDNTSVMPLAFDGLNVLWSGNGRDVRRWNPKEGWKQIELIPDHDGKLELARSSGPAFSMHNGKPCAGPWPMGLALEEDLGATWDGGDNKRLALIDRNLDVRVGSLAMPESDRVEDHEIGELLFNWDGTVLATASAAVAHLKLWEPVSGRLLAARTLSDDSDVRLAFSSDYHGLLAATDAKGTLLFKYRRSRVTGVWGMRPALIDDADVTLSSFSFVTARGTPDGTTDLDHWSRNFPLAGRYGRFNVLDQVPGPDQKRLIAVSADGKYLATVLDGALRIWDIPGRNRIIAEKAGPTRGIAYAPDGALWLLADKTLTRWSRESPLTGESPVELTAFSVSDEEVLLGRADGALCRFRPGGQIEPVSQLGSEPVTSIARHAETVVAGTRGGDVFVLRGGREVAKLPNAHAAAVTAATVNPSGWFATGGDDKAVRVWNPEGKLVLTLPQTGKVRRVFWRPYGRMLILVEGERALRLREMGELKKELTALGIDPALP